MRQKNARAEDYNSGVTVFEVRVSPKAGQYSRSITVACYVLLRRGMRWSLLGTVGHQCATRGLTRSRSNQRRRSSRVRSYPGVSRHVRSPRHRPDLSKDVPATKGSGSCGVSGAERGLIAARAGRYESREKGNAVETVMRLMRLLLQMRTYRYPAPLHFTPNSALMSLPEWTRSLCERSAD